MNIDPCMGSGHILVYAFDVLMQIYEAAGYTQRAAAKSILENNIYGLDIDDRAFQMAYFAVMMKARQYNRRILNGKTDCHVYAIQESNTINRDQLKYFGAGLSDLEKNDAINQITYLLDTFMDSKEYGSILDVEPCNWDLLRRFASETGGEAQMSMDSMGLEETKAQLQTLIDIGKVMAQKYDVVVTNPPYMGSSGMGAKLNEFVKKNYPDSKSDLFACFISKGNRMVKKNAYNCMVTMQSWMFLSSFEKMRTSIVSTKNITNLMHMENMVLGIAFGTAVTVFQNCHINGYKGTYNQIKLADIEKDKPREFPVQGNRFSQVSTDNFSKIPGSPIAYWVSESVFNDFQQGKQLHNYIVAKHGLTTGNVEFCLRCWFEVARDKIGFSCVSQDDFWHKNYTWAPHHKGGAFRKWYGNNDYVLGYNEYYNKKMDTFPGHRHDNPSFYFREGITWTDLTSGTLGARYSPSGFIFDVSGPTAFVKSGNLYTLLAFMCSKVVAYFMDIMNSTMHFLVGQMNLLPVLNLSRINDSKIKENIALSKSDWDAFEASWDFTHHPLVRGGSISEAYALWERECNHRFSTLKSNEEELNRIFIDIYGLQDELTPEVEDKDVTVRKADLRRDIRSLISYAIGCMFGRYSLDVPGLAYAGGEWDNSQYHTFIPDRDNVLPITDEEYFEDDIVGLFCAWLKKVYGADTLEENLDFIAKALGSKGDTSREVIRNYFLNDFFKDHCKTYSVTGSGKRPIYWLFDSGKQNGFKALIYMHRYDENTIGNLRIDYLHRMERIYDSEIARMQDIIDNSSAAREVTAATKRKEKLQKQVKECKEYDEKIAHLALARIAIDLDDGVKVNYEKVQIGTDGKKYTVLAKI